MTSLLDTLGLQAWAACCRAACCLPLKTHARYVLCCAGAAGKWRRLFSGSAGDCCSAVCDLPHRRKRVMVLHTCS